MLLSLTKYLMYASPYSSKNMSLSSSLNLFVWYFFPSQYQVIALVQKFGSNVLSIMNAIFLEKRVLFLGKESIADDICGCVLAAVRLVSTNVKFYTNYTV